MDGSPSLSVYSYTGDEKQPFLTPPSPAPTASASFEDDLLSPSLSTGFRSPRNSVSWNHGLGITDKDDHLVGLPSGMSSAPPSPSPRASFSLPSSYAHVQGGPSALLPLPLPPIPKRASAKLAVVLLLAACMASAGVLLVKGAWEDDSTPSKTLWNTVGLSGWGASQAAVEGSEAEGGTESVETSSSLWSSLVSPTPAAPPEDPNAPIPLRLSPPFQPPLSPERKNKHREKFLGYQPHSGFHNQRIELQNALLLAQLLDRTLLVPPIWMGWPSPGAIYDDLQASWTALTESHPEAFNLSQPVLSASSPPAFTKSSTSHPLPYRPRHFPTLAEKLAHAALQWPGVNLTADGYPILPDVSPEQCKSFSPECRFTFRDTWLDWGWLVGRGKQGMQAVGKTRARWDMREQTLLEDLGVTASDVFVLHDVETREFLYDLSMPPSPLIDNWTSSFTDNSHSFLRRVSIAGLAQRPESVILVGSLFSSARIKTPDPNKLVYSSHRAKPLKVSELRKSIIRSMAFRAPEILTPAREVVRLLGGREGFLGVHARVGDGTFAKNAAEGVAKIWRRLMERLDVDPAEKERLWAEVSVPLLEERYGVTAEEEEQPTRQARARRSLQPNATVEGWHPQRWGSRRHPSVALAIQDDSTSLPSSWAVMDSLPLPSEDSDDWSPHRHHAKRQSDPDSSLRISTPRLEAGISCRGALHDPSGPLGALNVPIYLATDARSPTTDPALRVLWRTFPCLFLLSDFEEHAPSIKRMHRLVDASDGGKLDRILLPFLEAAIAAMAQVTIGTQGSTFSGFAEGPLHTAYTHDAMVAAEALSRRESSKGWTWPW